MGAANPQMGPNPPGEGKWNPQKEPGPRVRRRQWQHDEAPAPSEGGHPNPVSALNCTKWT